jgi:hypothetical protein
MDLSRGPSSTRESPAGFLLVWVKHRAGAIQRRSFRTTAPFEPPALVREILEWTSPLRSLAPIAMRRRVSYRALRSSVTCVASQSDTSCLVFRSPPSVRASSGLFIERRATCATGESRGQPRPAFHYGSLHRRHAGPGATSYAHRGFASGISGPHRGHALE